MALNVGVAGGPTARVRRWALPAALVAVLCFLALLPTGRAHGLGPAIRLYIFAGQSNMVGYSTNSGELASVDPTLTAPASSARFWGPVADYATRWTTLQAPTEVLQPVSHAGFGPEISVAPVLARRHSNATVAIVKLARNNTSLSVDWSSRNVVGLYPQLINRVLAARRQLAAETGARVEVAGFFWMQGESDAFTKRTADAYARNLGRFITSVRSHLTAPDMPFVVARIANLKEINRAFRYSDTVRQAQEYVAATIPHTHLVSTDGLQRDPSSPIHFSTRGTVDLGRRFGRIRV